MATEIVGRDVELTSLDRFLASSEEGLAALVLEGPPGIGKSTLWLAAVERARALGHLVLATRPAEADSELAHAGLGDLLEHVLDDVLPFLPRPRRRALELALLLEEGPAVEVDPRAIATGVRSALELLSADEPVVVAVDDVQWLDAASAAALAFALHRLEAAPVRLVLARRTGERTAPTRLEHALGDRLVERIAVGPMSVGALHRFLRGRLDHALARQTLLRVHEQAGGNPFFALELARRLGRDFDPLEPLPVPGSLDELVGDRIARLPRKTRDALALTAALGSPSEQMLRRAGVTMDVLRPALRSQVVERDGDTIRFTHPLLSSLAYRGLDEEGRVVHGLAARVALDPLARARHLALSKAVPDARTARSIDAAARLAIERGAAALGAELSEQAVRLTPERAVEARRRRTLASARAHLMAGEWTRARSIATVMRDEAAHGRWRAEALLLLAEIEIDDLAVPILDEALAEAAGHPDLQARIHSQRAAASRFRRGFADARRDAYVALALADELDDDALRFEALTIVAWLSISVGTDGAEVARMRTIAESRGDESMLRTVEEFEVQMIGRAGPLDQARVAFKTAIARWHEVDELSTSSLMWNLAWVELWSGHWRVAAELAEGARDISLQYGLEKNQDYIPTAWVALHRGQFELACSEADRGLELCERQIGFDPPLLRAVGGIVASWSGDPAGGVELLAVAESQADRLGWREPTQRPWTAEYVEALLALGRIPEAVGVLERWSSDTARLGRPRIEAHVTRCRGLVAAAGGATDEAANLLDEAARRHEKDGEPFARARALLALGTVRRRQLRKRAAREAFEAALAGFEQLGSPPWVERARAELGQIGGRSRETGLTPAERRVAVLVAAGHTNREVAAELFLGERTVAGHLTRVYAKLGVRSRTELARALR
jgi:DNA-binding CsgD family transcriptional regulator